MAQNTPGDSDSPKHNTRRRKRRRRASSHAQNNNGSHNGGTKNPNNGGEKNNKGNRKRRGGNNNQRRQGGNNQRGNQRNNQRSRGGGSNRYRKPQHNSAQYASQNMETRDETSAGGLVVSGMAEAVASDGSVDMSQIYVALIGRLDRRGRLLWSMPKGHVEPGEHQWDTARREVWEETGITGEPFAELGIIDYWFVSDGVRIHKTVHHNLLRYVDGVLNDEDPEVTEVAWVPVSELIEHLAYADERKLARIAFDKMPDYARAEKEAGRTTPR
ncbi:NUDIX hydrolase [Corynebacterium urinipleomorphum]|uniref:NUDIX hydrolase n=1 Tax=Corynebacterium urinipleomorphum TaxID=1852380 RepID=UPI000B364A4F|nr:NUDIX hydrolase [Corynebacterium urinipleomorphum]